MGISGLIPLLREAQHPGHIKDFSGQTVGIDSYIWLYKGAFACASDLALNQPTTKYVSFFLTRARMLRHYGVEPLFVFDGGPLPSKLGTELERQRARAERRQQGIKLWNQSKRKKAFEQFQRCVEVTPLMAKTVIEELKREGFQYIVAPYEADAQLAYLESQGVISAAISEDSDLIVFGCRTIIFKLDQFGAATIFDRALILRDKDIGGWSDAQIRRMCILSGCDYVPSVPGVGLKRAHRYVSRSCDLRSAVQLMRNDKLAVPEGYDENVERAELTFRYQRVYDPRSRALAFVTPLDESAPPLADMPFIGVDLEQRVAHGIAVAELDPVSYLPFAQIVVVAPPTLSLVAAASASAETLPKPVAGGRSAVAAAAAATATPVVRAKSLLSFWGRPKSTLQSRPAAVVPPPPPPPPPLVFEDEDCIVVVAVPTDAQPVVREDSEVNVKFRGNDQHSELVSTTQMSRFFAKQQPPPLPLTPLTDNSDTIVSAPILSPSIISPSILPPILPPSPPPLLPLAPLTDDSDTADLSLASTQVADSAFSPLCPLPESQGETVVEFNLDSSTLSQPRVLRSGTVIASSSPARPVLSTRRQQPSQSQSSLMGDETSAISLFGQFMYKKGSKAADDDIPEYAKHPTYSKKEECVSKLVASSDGLRTPITQLLARRRISSSTTDHQRLALQPIDDNKSSSSSSSSSLSSVGKRKNNVALLDDVKKFRYPLMTPPPLHRPPPASIADDEIIDDIVDSSDCDAENRAITI